jgi:hypothetical protein
MACYRLRLILAMTVSKNKPRRASHPADIELAQQIAELRGVTVAGFKAVNDHLATLNGRVGKHDELFGKILGNEKFQDGTKNGIGLAWKVFLALVTIALGVFGIIATYHSYPHLPASTNSAYHTQ